MRKRAAVFVLLVGLALAACGTYDQGVTATRSRRNTAQTPTTAGTVPSSTDPGSSTPDTTSDTTDTTPASSPGITVPDDTTFDTKPPDSTIDLPNDQQVIDFGSSKKPEPYDGFLVAAFRDIEQFWTEQMPATFGKPFEPLEGGIFAAYRSREEDIPGCGSQRTRYRDVEGNAFYCSVGDFIVYDDDELLPQLVANLGQSSVGVVLAHEFGHAIQQRNGEFDQPTILKEQQADCFAGAWAAHVSRGEAEDLTFGDEEIKSGLIAMISVADPTNGDVDDPDAHGTGFDRVGAFQDGFNGGTARCKTFFTEGRIKNLIDIAPVLGDSGDLPFDDPTANSDIVRSIPEDLDRFWVDKLNTEQGVAFTAPTLATYPTRGPYPTCDEAADRNFRNNIFFCPSVNQIMVDRDWAEELGARFGDLGVGYLIGDAYSEAVQTATGSTLTGEARVLLNDCLTGAWVADDIPVSRAVDAPPRGGGNIRLSAGDLDEAIIIALRTSDETTDENRRGTAFEKINSFRKGVLGGIAACQTPTG